MLILVGRTIKTNQIIYGLEKIKLMRFPTVGEIIFVHPKAK